MFNIVFSLIIALSSGFMWGVVNFSSFGILIGYWGYHLFKEQEYYLYHNLGLSKRKLVIRVWITNILIAIPVLLLTYIIKS